MESTIRINKSRLEIVAYILSFVLACYWVAITEISLTFQLLFFALLIAFAGLFFRSHRRHQFKGYFRLAGQGFVALTEPVTTNTAEEAKLYKVKLLQRLPWALHLEIHHANRSFKTLVWRDAFEADDWRKIRQYLSELNPQ